jgi:hypothetical protein
MDAASRISVQRFVALLSAGAGTVDENLNVPAADAADAAATQLQRGLVRVVAGCS